ncbi:MAG: carcinine hydrolase/isopenicillin-N N-acyltransferase family protein, partial [Longimicrobiales bacterium]|nr:carcinine hydrolase/isopenicillin-N N-acyltransferase family protein [Longimicrobiales bacterium]
MNDDGLVVSLAYGGRPGTGTGFAIPLVVRYLLEVCVTVNDAREVLERVPVAAAYNLTICDAFGATATVFVAPNSAPEVFDTPLATNHRGRVPEYPELAQRFNSVERLDTLQQLFDTHAATARATSAFLQSPLHNTAFSRGFATLYTAVYQPDHGVVDYFWPDASWRRGFDSPQDTKDVILREPAAA